MALQKIERQFPENWKLVSLKDYVFFQEGPGLRKWQFCSKGIKIINVKNIVANDLLLDNSKNFCSELEVRKKYEHFLLNENDIVMASSGVTWGKTAIVKASNLPLMLNTSVIRFRSLDQNILRRDFLKIFLDSSFFKRQIDRLITGGCQPNFGPSHLKKVNLLLPSILAQDNIISSVKKAEQLQRWRKESDKLTNDYLNSVFIKMFGNQDDYSQKWCMVNFGDTISILADYHANGSYKTLKKHVTLKQKEDFALMVRTTDLEANNFVKDVNYIAEDAYYFLKKSKIFGGEIIINKIGSAGKVYLMPNLNRPVSLGMNAFLIRLNSKASNVFIYYLLNSRFGNGIIQKEIRGAVTKTITKDAVRHLRIPLPPIELQKKFSEIVDIINQVKKVNQSTKCQIDNLFNAIMQRAFQEELV